MSLLSLTELGCFSGVLFGSYLCSHCFLTNALWGEMRCEMGKWGRWEKTLPGWRRKGRKTAVEGEDDKSGMKIKYQTMWHLGTMGTILERWGEDVGSSECFLEKISGNLGIFLGFLSLYCAPTGSSPCMSFRVVKGCVMRLCTMTHCCGCFMLQVCICCVIPARNYSCSDQSW